MPKEKSRYHAPSAAAAWIVAASLILLGLADGFPNDNQQEKTAPAVTPVVGRSWLKHLGLSAENTAMGQMGGVQPPAPSQRTEPELSSRKSRSADGMGGIMNRIWSLFRSDSRQVSSLMNETFVLTGSDLYRLNCQSCHGPNGVGSPPEINSLIGPVQGASPTFIKERIKKLGRSTPDNLARELAASADSSIRLRLENGGEKMPPFRHLRGDEVEALMQYLRDLAAVPREESKEILVTQSVARVGEHVVKGTCHICHDATGPGGGHMGMMQGVTPSLASFPEEKSLQDVVRQVEDGSSRMMGMMGGSTMPALPYITENEVAAAYLYLLHYPPEP